MARAVLRHRLIRRVVILIGANPAGEAVLARLLAPSTRLQYDVVQVFADPFDARQSGTMLGVPIVSDMNLLTAYAQTNVIDLVVVALPIARAARVGRADRGSALDRPPTW